MSGGASRIRTGVALLALAMAPLGIHIAIATRHGMVWAGTLVIAEAALIAWFALSFVPVPGLRWIGCATVLAVTAAIWRFSPDGIAAASAIPHAIAYLSLLAAFGASLAPGRKAIVTVFAEKSRGELSPAVILYTRRVTWAWCVFCACQLLGSSLLLVFAPAWVWSAFVNLCNPPLLAAMFCGEFAWREWHHGSAPCERLTDSVRMAARVARSATPHDAI